MVRPLLLNRISPFLPIRTQVLLHFRLYRFYFPLKSLLLLIKCHNPLLKLIEVLLLLLQKFYPNVPFLDYSVLFLQ
jgi:hypothetical protein